MRCRAGGLGGARPLQRAQARTRLRRRLCWHWGAACAARREAGRAFAPCQAARRACRRVAGAQHSSSSSQAAHRQQRLEFLPA